VLISSEESDPDGQARVVAFRQGLSDLGWTEGRNIQIDYRWGTGTTDRARTNVAELINLAPDVIVANGTPATAAVHEATQSIPVVFVVVFDPVGAGFVHSLSQPGGNITGFSTFEPEIGGKWLELLNEVSPGLQHVAGLSDPSYAAYAAVWRTVENSAQRARIKTSSIDFRDPDFDIEPPIAALSQSENAALIVMPTTVNNLARKRIISLAMRYRLPAVYPFRPYAVEGGLISYGFDPVDLFRRAASYIDRILKGERPADLPVQAPTKFELIINLKTVKALGLAIPDKLLALADRVIE
jgi:putative tryptophan/tyrosine transport system substrate-binding protein